ncbi:hypothetical protein, partial [Bacteroides heparinolyticus]|uniref:hypothetical protein n=1 Tax=Prevotella heparinolytica TaxID=28113 RepID=UPI00359FDB63
DPVTLLQVWRKNKAVAHICDVFSAKVHNSPQRTLRAAEFFCLFHCCNPRIIVFSLFAELLFRGEML